MNLRLDRKPTVDGVTLGQLFRDGWFQCFTLEDQIRPDGEKVAGRTAIPAGRYQVGFTFSERFQRMLPILLDVPGFTGIRIHAGNDAHDTEGCLLVGTGRAGLSLTGSQAALAPLVAEIRNARAKGEAVWIDIVNPSSDPPTVRV